MFQALKLGFRNLSFVRFSAVDYWSPKFSGTLSVNLKMSSKRVRSKSSNVDLSKIRKNDAKASSGDECEDVETMTLQQMKSKMRSSDVPARGANHTIVSPLKSKMDGTSLFLALLMHVGERSSVVQDQAVSEEKPTVAKTVPKRKAKGISDSDKVGAERAERRVKQSSVHATEVNTLESTSEQELIIKSIEMEGETSIQVKRKVSSRTTTSKVDLPVEEPWTVLTHKKPQKSWTAYNPKTMRSPPIDASTAHMKLMSWNVNGLRALLKLESFSALQLAQKENFDVLCLQETKLQDKDVDAIRQTLIEGYDNSYWTCSVAKLGYSGTAIISRIKPVSVRYGLGMSDHDSEGRLVTVEFENFFLLCGYVPNSGDGLRRLSYRINEWDPSLSNYMKDLERTKPVILTGDLNCCHQEIDIWNPAGNKRSAGFTDEERQSFQTNFLDRGFVDTFRKQHPDAVGYTYWGYRHGGRKNNKGWRLDYFLASESIADQVHDSFILPDVGGSDHSPIGLVLKL